MISRHMLISQLFLLPNALPPISFASKQLWSESIPIYLEHTQIVIFDLSESTVAMIVRSLEDFLGQFKNGFVSIRMLELNEIKA
jgi:hypothetical protein